MFDYPLKQHDSQTLDIPADDIYKFDYPLKQHDSQTYSLLKTRQTVFDYPLKQHDSQTSNQENATTQRCAILESTNVFFFILRHVLRLVNPQLTKVFIQDDRVLSRQRL